MFVLNLKESKPYDTDTRLAFVLGKRTFRGLFRREMKNEPRFSYKGFGYC